MEKLCTICGEQPKSRYSNSWCNKCKTAKSAVLRAKRIAVNQCTRCGEQKEVSSRRECNACSQRHTDNVTTRRHKIIVSGLCANCSSEKEQQSKKMCNACLDAHTTRSREYYRAIKVRAVEFLGGACVDCGLRTDKVEVYDFHHINPEDKESEIAKLAVWTEIVEELRKCELLCSNCHRIREAYQRAA